MNLTGIISTGSVPLGGITFLPHDQVGLNPTINGQEFLRSGYMKTYSSQYDPLIAVSKWYGQANINTAPVVSSWSSGGLLGGKVEYSNANSMYYYVYYNSTTSGVLYGTSFSSNTLGSAMYGSGTITDSLSFKGYVCYGYQTPGSYYTSPTGLIGVANGSTAYLGFPDIYSSLGINYVIMAANTTTAFAIGTSSSYQINWANTTNGNSWIARGYTGPTPSNNFVRFCWSNTGNVLILVDGNGTIYTSPDCNTWTQRTTPTNVSNLFVSSSYAGYAAYGEGNVFPSTRCAASTGVTLISLAYGQLLRTTDGTNFTSIDLYNTLGATYGIQQYFIYAPYLLHDGTRFIMFPRGTPYSSVGSGQKFSTFTFTSTDGLTWSPGWSIYNSTGKNITLNGSTNSSNANNIGSVCIANNRMFMLSSPTSTGNVAPYDITGKVYSTNPDTIGMQGWPGTYNGAAIIAGTNMTAYLRVK